MCHCGVWTGCIPVDLDLGLVMVETAVVPFIKPHFTFLEESPDVDQIILAGLNLLNSSCVSSGFEVGTVCPAASCLLNDWATFTGWTSEQCFHLLKIPAAPASGHVGHPPRLVLRPAGLARTRRGCCFEEKDKPSEASLSSSFSLSALSWSDACSLHIKFSLRHKNYTLDVEYCLRFQRSCHVFPRSTLLFSEAVCSGFRSYCTQSWRFWKPHRTIGPIQPELGACTTPTGPAGTM